MTQKVATSVRVDPSLLMLARDSNLKLSKILNDSLEAIFMQDDPTMEEWDSIEKENEEIREEIKKLLVKLNLNNSKIQKLEKISEHRGSEGRRMIDSFNDISFLEGRR